MSALKVAIVGCGLIGHKRAVALDADCELIGSYDVSAEATQRLADEHGGIAAGSLDELLALGPDVVVVAVTHDQLTPVGVAVLEAGAHLLVEKPAGLSTNQIAQLKAAAEASGKLVKVGFNHRFHPGIMRATELAHSGEFGEILHVRGRYGHGGRPGYDREWRAEPARSGGGELIDQGMHLLDLTHWVLGDLPLHSALLRTQFWDTVVDDNAVLVLGEKDSRTAPWAMLHVTWTEWKNMFSLEIYCRTAKLQIDGLTRSYGPQTLRVYRMSEELGPPEVEEITYPKDDPSWDAEWAHFADAIRTGKGNETLLGNLDDAAWAWARVQDAYEAGGYGDMRAQVGA
ncbi:MAG: Gfo/Idh/MocA family oxidoreductase [Patulibacter minatonensis]